jgi:hypothetical protein
MKLDRKKARLIKMHEDNDDGYVDATPGERMSIVCELTKEAWAFVEGVDVEQPLQRDVAVLIKRKS